MREVGLKMSFVTGSSSCLSSFNSLLSYLDSMLEEEGLKFIEVHDKVILIIGYKMKM